MTASDEKFTRQQLLRLERLTPGLFGLRCSRAPGFRFRAGQFARLGVETPGGERVWRPYSMLSAPHDEFLEFLSVRVPGGEFSRVLGELKVGDPLWVERQAYGFLTLERFPDGEDLWLLATGTGVAPFLSILQDFEVWQRFARIVLVYSVRHAAELACQALIHGLAGRDYLAGLGHKLTYLPLLTGESRPGTQGGRITTLLASGELERAAGLALDPARSRLMLCGNPQMIEDCRALLKTRGMQLSLSRRPGQLAVENYW